MSEEQSSPSTRRGFLGTASSVAMTGGLLAGYGTFFGYAGRFLYPVGEEPRTWMFVTDVGSFRIGSSRSYRTPAGAAVVITRLEEDRFLALSSTCPHLGCQVHWETSESRLKALGVDGPVFFCPCHNGVFTPEGKGIQGPPGEAGQSLPRYPLKVEDDLLYIEVPTTRSVAETDGIDPCLRPGRGEDLA